MDTYELQPQIIGAGDSMLRKDVSELMNEFLQRANQLLQQVAPLLPRLYGSD